jgi:very-short-patch-repair endonuclease
MRGPDTRKVGIERRLRRQSTDAETALWLALRDRRLGGFKFVRQEAIGPYIVDFICRETSSSLKSMAVSMRRTRAIERATNA